MKLLSWNVNWMHAALRYRLLDSLLPIALLGVVAGVFADRWPLKPTRVASDAVRAVRVLLLLLAMQRWYFYATGRLEGQEHVIRERTQQPIASFPARQRAAIREDGPEIQRRGCPVYHGLAERESSKAKRVLRGNVQRTQDRALATIRATLQVKATPCQRGRGRPSRSSRRA